VSYNPGPDLNEDMKTDTGLILERFIRYNSDYKEEYYVVWFPLWQGSYISQPAVVILSIDELMIHE